MLVEFILQSDVKILRQNYKLRNLILVSALCKMIGLLLKFLK